jgi:iron complex outermembrane receptor protein
MNQGTNNSSAYILYDTVKSNGYDPHYGQISSENVYGRLVGNTNPTKNKTRDGSCAFYASDVINLTDRWLAMISLRVDRFESKGSLNIRTGIRTGAYKQTSFSPKFGLVYQVLKDRIAFFANYMNGFKNVAPVSQSTGEVSVFKPQKANQLEAGIKLQSNVDKFQVMLSAYDITVDNITRNITQNINGDFYNIVIQDGRQRSRGLELELNAAPFPGLAFRGSYAYNDSKILRSDASVEKRRPVSAGPAHLANAWLQYQCRTASLKGFGIGAGFNYAAENMVTNNSITGIFTLPSYTILNASLFYAPESYRLTLKIDNIGNRHYWKGWTTLEPQMPRRIALNLSFRF